MLSWALFFQAGSAVSISNFPSDEQFEQLKEMTPDMFGLPGNTADQIDSINMSDADRETIKNFLADPPRVSTREGANPLDEPQFPPGSPPEGQDNPLDVPQFMPPPPTGFPPEWQNDPFSVNPFNVPQFPPGQTPPSGQPTGGEFYEVDQQAREIRMREQDPENLLEAIRELPERIAEALRNG